MRCVARGLAAFMLGAIVAIALLVALPALYMRLADGLAWRLNRAPVSQAVLEGVLGAIYRSQDRGLAQPGTILLGDSHLHRLPGSLLAGVTTNFAISGETARNLADRIGDYQSLKNAKRIVILAGRNDLNRGVDDVAIDRAFARMLAAIPDALPVVVIGIPPLADALFAQRERLQATNAALARRCRLRTGCRFVAVDIFADAAGALAPRFDSGDGVHLNAAGNVRLADELNVR